MKNGARLLLYILLLVGFASVSTVNAEEISNFQVNYGITKDGRVEIRESITYDFGSVYRHGIYRKIPSTFSNKAGKTLQLDISVNKVSDENGKYYRYTTSWDNTDLTIKIGDPDSTITGVHTYVINYTVSGAIRYFSDHDEFYWNVNGSKWEVPITQVLAQVTLPEAVKKDNLKAICYTGYSGSTAQNCQSNIVDGDISIGTTNALDSSENLTFAVSFPKGVVAVLEPKEHVDFWDTIGGRILLLAIFVGAIAWYLILPIILPLLWFLYGRDPNTGPDARAYFDPPETKAGRKLTAIETGTIIDEHVEKRDHAALFVSLAQKGYYTIVEKKKGDFYLIKKKEPDDELMKFERYFLEHIVGDNREVKLTSARFATTGTSIADQVYKQTVSDGFFGNNPDSTRNSYAVLMGFASITFNLPLLLSATIFGLNMVRKTLVGSQAASKARALRNFLKSQERQLNYQGDKQLLFEKLLPYAVAFGVEKSWIGRFETMDLKTPDWYESHDGNFTYAGFYSGLHSSTNSFASSITPVTSSSGSSSGFSGGSSGGGGGGGGGGSW